MEQHTTEHMSTKPWYLSRTIIGGIIAGAAGVLGLTDLDMSLATDLIVSGASVIGGAMSVYGRIKATKKITAEGVKT